MKGQYLVPIPPRSGLVPRKFYEPFYVKLVIVLSNLARKTFCASRTLYLSAESSILSHLPQYYIIWYGCIHILRCLSGQLENSAGGLFLSVPGEKLLCKTVSAIGSVFRKLG